MYIIFEGIDTCGKTTQMDLLKNIEADVVVTKEPGGSEVGVTIRDIILHRGLKSKEAEMFLFLADRAEHFTQVVEPNLDKLILSDRGFISGLAYAKTNDENVDLDLLVKLNKIALKDTFPDMIFLFQIDEKTLIKRVLAKNNDKIEERGIKYLLNVQTNMELITKQLGLKYEVIDATLDIETIHNKIKSLI